MKFMETGWLKGNAVRTARKSYRCDFWKGQSSGGFCRNKIEPGDQYVEGDPNDEAGGFGRDRVCMACAQIETPA
jgi:hypothetical protein